MISSKKTLLQFLSVALLLSVSPGNALTPRNALAEEDVKEEKAERIEVTGSHIRRTDVEGVSPIETVSKKDIESKGYTNLGDVVRDIGANSFGSGTVSGNSTAPGNADISLRGLGADNTLVLLNGQRLPQDAITGTVDINLIPIAAIERIEILKDGASAVYGSDALAGVVNIITKKDFEGTQLNASQNFPTSYSDGKKTKVGLVNGINSEKLNVVTSLDFRYDQAVYSKNRDWSNNNLSLTGNPPSYANTGGADAGVFKVTGSCPAGLLTTTPDGSTYCQFRYSDFSQEAPRVSQFGGMSEAHYELNSDIKLNGRVAYIHRDAETILAASPGSIRISSATAAGMGATGTNGSDVAVNIRLTPLGTRVNDITTNSYSGLLGATVQLPKDWQLDIGVNLNVVSTRLEGSSGYALKSGVQDLINTGAFNPFAAVGSQGDLSSASYLPYEDSKSVQWNIDAKASGDLMEIGAGPVSMAVGTLVSYTSYTDQADEQTLNNNVFGNAGSSGAGHRTSEALYSEISVPLISKTLEAQVAGRFDHYSDFGSTFNPKVGLLYHVSPSLLFRGSLGTGFRAPLLSELYAGQSIGYPSFIDKVACNQYGGDYCQAQQYQVTSGGNSNLREESSVSYTLGTVFAPTPKFNVGADWFYTNINNVPGINLGDMTKAEANGVNPAQYGVIVTRNAGTNIIESVYAPLQNLSKTEEMGVDLTATYLVDRFRLSTEQNQIFYYNSEGFPGAGLENKLGQSGLPRWRNTTSVGYHIADNQDVAVTSRTIPGQETLDQTGVIPWNTTFDMNYTYRTKKIGSFSIAVVNIIGTTPPLDPSNPQNQVNYSLYDPNGRQVVIGYQAKL